MPNSRSIVRTVAVAGIALSMLVAAMSGYEVQEGDTLAEIAADHGVSTQELIDANDISNPNRIYVGQVLTIPGVDGGTDRLHTVAWGDTLGTIAWQYGTSVSSISAANGISNPNRIYPGQVLVIPGEAGSSGIYGTPRTHTVRAGESLAVIASNYGVTVDQIKEANGITNGNLIFVGSTLNIDAPEALAAFDPEVSSAPATHIVEAGDSLGGIAARYGVELNELIAQNAISNPDLIRVGQVLELPGAGGWRCPVPGGTFFNDWGFPRSGGRIHEGNDIFAPRGTPVHAPVAGFVHHYTGTVGGLQFRLDGDDGHRYIGTHLEAFGESGDVRAGAVIGFVGDSGNAIGSRPHLHFEVHPNRDEPINPYPTLAEACR